MKTLIIIPLYNEEENLEFVISDLKNAGDSCDLVFIDDNSTDNTLKKIRNITDFPILELPVNLGIGGGVQLGFIFARENGYDFAIQYDGDGQHIASEIPKILHPLLENKADVVIGSRFLIDSFKYKGQKARKIGIKYFQFVISLFTGVKITDSTSGFRAYNKKVIRYLSENYPSDYPEPEAVILFHKNNFKVIEVAVEMRQRVKGKSSISGLISVYYMLKVTISIIFSNFQKYKK